MVVGRLGRPAIWIATSCVIAIHGSAKINAAEIAGAEAISQAWDTYAGRFQSPSQMPFLQKFNFTNLQKRANFAKFKKAMIQIRLTPQKITSLSQAAQPRAFQALITAYAGDLNHKVAWFQSGDPVSLLELRNAEEEFDDLLICKSAIDEQQVTLESVGASHETVTRLLLREEASDSGTAAHETDAIRKAWGDKADAANASLEVETIGTGYKYKLSDPRWTLQRALRHAPSSGDQQNMPPLVQRLIAAGYIEIKPLLGDLDHSSESMDVFLLDQGGGGGRVFRVVPKTGSGSYVEKHYHDDYTLKKDLRRLSILSHAMALESGQHNLRIINVINTSQDHVMRMEDIRGQDAYFVHLGIQIAPAKLIFEAYFAQQLRMLRDALLLLDAELRVNGSGYISAIHETLMWELPALTVDLSLKTEEGAFEEHNLIIKSDNVLVTPTGELVLIDPY